MRFIPKNPKLIAKEMEADTKKADDEIAKIRAASQSKVARLADKSEILGQQLANFVTGGTPAEGVDLCGFMRWNESSDETVPIPAPIPTPAAPPQVSSDSGMFSAPEILIHGAKEKCPSDVERVEVSQPDGV